MRQIRPSRDGAGPCWRCCLRAQATLPTFAVRPPRAHDGRTCRPFWMARRAEERTCSFATRTMPRVIPEQEEQEAAPCPDLDARARRDSTCFREGKKRAVRFFLLGFSCSDFGLLSWEPASFGSWVRSYQLRVPLEGGTHWQLATRCVTVKLPGVNFTGNSDHAPARPPLWWWRKYPFQSAC